jgi:PAT family beta-lactamase induction signal transducer AmpG
MLFIFLNGISSGFPWVIIGSAMTLWLKDVGLTRTAIGIFGSIFAVYSINWLWSPIVDRFKIPILKSMGQRRSWIFFTQFMLVILILSIANIDPDNNLVLTSLIAILIAISSATQDIAIDAYRIDSFDINEQKSVSAAASLATVGWWTGYGLLGWFALTLAGESIGFSWSKTYMFLALIMAILMFLTLFFITAPKYNPEIKQLKDYQFLLSKIKKVNKIKIFITWLYVSLVNPLKDFFVRFGYLAIGLFVFIFLFKIGEAFLGKMSLVFYKEIGFSTDEIATYVKLIGWFFTIIYSFLAGFVSIRYSLVKGLLLGGISMSLTNLFFAYIALTGANTNVLFLAIVFDNFTAAFSTVTFVAFISYLTNKAYSATQYAIMSSFANFGRTVFASFSGVMIDNFQYNWHLSLNNSWALFFVITTLMVIPSLLIIIFFSSKFKTVFK